MALVNSEQQEIIVALADDLDRCSNESNHVDIHIHTNSMVIRNCIIPEDVSVCNEFIAVEQGNFMLELDIKSAVEFDIQYFSEEDSYYMRSDDLEVYFDLM